MKCTLIGLATIAMVTISANVSAGLEIERSNTTIGSTKNYSQIRDGLGLNFSYIDHDDSVGTRGNTSGISGTSVINSDKSKVNDTLTTIDCEHPTYAVLCANIKNYVEDLYSDGGDPPVIDPPVVEPEDPTERQVCEAKKGRISHGTVDRKVGRQYCTFLETSHTTYHWNETLKVCDAKQFTTSEKMRCGFHQEH